MNRIDNFLLLSLVLTLFVCDLKSQVVASDDVYLCEGEQGNVEVILSATSFAVDLNDSNIYTDDIFGSVIDLGFDFVFYGNTYNQVVLASNNYLSFNTFNAGNYSDWTIDAAIPTNLEPETQNSILCPWQDIYPGANGNGTIQYATTGEAPNRVFIASFCGIPMFSCTDICYSSQIKLFEGSNIIETHIAQKVLCTTWNEGAAVHGLHNIDGTIAHVVTGLDGIVRNFPNQWTCENDAWRFTPNGNDDYVIENMEFAPAVAGTDIIWQDEFGNQIGTGGQITVIPGGNVTYTAGASLCGDAGDWCGFEGGIEGDDVSIFFEELNLSGNGNDVSCFELNNGTIEVFAPYEGNWIYNLYDSNSTLILSENSSNEEFIFQNLSPGEYFIDIQEESSLCVSSEINISINQPAQIISSDLTSDVSCFGGSDGLIEITIEGGISPYTTYLYNANQENISTESGDLISFNNLESGDYYYSVLDSNGCLITGDEIIFNINQPNEIIIELNETGGVSCNNSEDGFIDITVSGGNPNYSYVWVNPMGDSFNTEDLQNVSGGNYSLTLTDQNGCEELFSIEINENEAVSFDVDFEDCNVNDIEISINASGGIPNYFYSLSYDNNIVDSNTNGNFEGLEAGEYLVSVNDSNNCESESYISLNSSPLANFETDEFEFSLSNEPTEFTDLSIDNNIISWSWDFGDGNNSNQQNPTNQYLQPGVYFVTLEVVDIFGCSDVITKELRVLQDYYSYTPNIFTPNNDGMNDTFSPSLMNIDYESYSLTIFDRWGNELFKTNKYEEGWDGKQINGEMLPSDIYSYKVVYKTNMGIEKKELGKIIMAK
ncbi:MAG: gliding motility-associated C-terminal domain-containing protein [Bacteroidota bacterium]|nr:gliding motility-associated C-terminal domain-containing protein [Bacteroidota bacterium]